MAKILNSIKMGFIGIVLASLVAGMTGILTSQGPLTAGSFLSHTGIVSTAQAGYWHQGRYYRDRPYRYRHIRYNRPYYHYRCYWQYSHHLGRYIKNCRYYRYYRTYYRRY